MQGILDDGWMHAPFSLGSDMKILEDSRAPANIKKTVALTVLFLPVQRYIPIVVNKEMNEVT